MSEYDHKSESDLRELYHSRGMSLEEIGDICSCHRQTVYYWMKKHGIEREDRQKRVERAKKRQPAHYRTDKSGYEIWRTWLGNGEKRARMPVHRLLAVAEYGAEAVKDGVVHHKNQIGWDNRPDNIEIMTDSEHKSHHAINGDYFGGGNNV